MISRTKISEPSEITPFFNSIFWFRLGVPPIPAAPPLLLKAICKKDAISSWCFLNNISRLLRVAPCGPAHLAWPQTSSLFGHLHQHDEKLPSEIDPSEVPVNAVHPYYGFFVDRRVMVKCSLNEEALRHAKSHILTKSFSNVKLLHISILNFFQSQILSFLYLLYQFSTSY